MHARKATLTAASLSSALSTWPGVTPAHTSSGIAALTTTVYLGSAYAYASFQILNNIIHAPYLSLDHPLTSALSGSHLPAPDQLAVTPYTPVPSNFISGSAW